MRKALLIVGIFILTTGCTFKPSKIEKRKTENVVRIFWHGGSNYSAMVNRPGTNELEVVFFPAFRCRGDSPGLRILQDVEPEKSMWVSSIIEYGGNFSSCFDYLNIHVHSEKDIDGGSEDHGKFGRSQIKVIQ